MLAQRYPKEASGSILNALEQAADKASHAWPLPHSRLPSLVDINLARVRRRNLFFCSLLAILGCIIILVSDNDRKSRALVDTAQAAVCVAMAPEHSDKPTVDAGTAIVDQQDALVVGISADITEEAASSVYWADPCAVRQEHPQSTVGASIGQSVANSFSKKDRDFSTDLSQYKGTASIPERRLAGRISLPDPSLTSEPTIKLATMKIDAFDRISLFEPTVTISEPTIKPVTTTSGSSIRTGSGGVLKLGR